MPCAVHCPDAPAHAPDHAPAAFQPPASPTTSPLGALLFVAGVLAAVTYAAPTWLHVTGVALALVGAFLFRRALHRPPMRWTTRALVIRLALVEARRLVRPHRGSHARRRGRQPVPGPRHARRRTLVGA